MTQKRTPTREFSKSLSKEEISKLGKLFAEIWFEGYRHRMAIFMAGMLSERGISHTDAQKIMILACDQVGADIEGRLLDLKLCYDKVQAGVPRIGEADFIKLAEELPSGFRTRALVVLHEIGSILDRRREMSSITLGELDRAMTSFMEIIDKHPGSYTKAVFAALKTFEKERDALQKVVAKSRHMKVQRFLDKKGAR